MAHIGGYELVEQLPRDEPVLKAFDRASGRVVALKERPGLDQERLQFDAMILSLLDHPNIAQIFDTISEDGLCYLVQEWIDGTDVASVRDHAGRLTLAQSVTAVRGALRGLAFAHNRQMVHGDVTPHNILVSTAGESKLVDFAAVATQAVGSARYRSPEVVAGSPATKRSDVYSAAAVLLDLIGVRPGRALVDVPGLDRSIAGVLSTALSENPEARQASGAQLLEDLEAAADRALGAGWPATESLSVLVADTIESRAKPEPEPTHASSASTAGVAVMQAAPSSTASRRVLIAAGAALLVLVALLVLLIAT